MLVHQMSIRSLLSALEIGNDKGDTPLHCAEWKGSLEMCESIAQAQPRGSEKAKCTNECSSSSKRNSIDGCMDEFEYYILCMCMDKAGNGGDSKEETETYTTLLVAAQKGVIEVVNEFLSQLPVSIYDTTSKDKNILQVAVENRQPRVIEAVQKQVNKELKLNLWADLIESVDTDENTILHLAAKYEESKVHPWQIHGTAMRTQWEIKWYEYVKSFSPRHFLSLSNAKDETPEQIFSQGHETLVKDSGEWLKDTSESCSVVAALVAGVSFATSSQVPGGTNGDTGRPTLERQPAFELFAITALIGLCFSVTALIMFLSILTSRKLPKDFKKNLPLKILLGLGSLFVSIASMLISFCAAHFFVLEDKFKMAVFPLYAATCLPVSFYAIVQFPLYMDLLKSIITEVPQSLPSGHV
ncbi:uncharacterized protein LOC114749851 [Neltuma alba]|uniref:uncharacterized protein LOC114749851 n=1 Tax=Neltuma alba TaxID=207710 RepID=UPI0010A3A9B2|nr:uncharacterized protein LOC114749851 [Prosopis alba]